MYHQLKNTLRTMDSCRVVCCCFTIFGTSLAAITTISVTMTCRLFGTIQSRGTMDYYCSVNGGHWFSLTLVISLILISSALLSLAGVVLTWLCHNMSQMQSDTESGAPKLQQPKKSPIYIGSEDKHTLLASEDTGVA